MGYEKVPVEEILSGSSRYGYKYRQILSNPVGQATSDAGGIEVLYVGVVPLPDRAGGVELRGVIAVIVTLDLLKVV